MYVVRTVLLLLFQLFASNAKLTIYGRNNFQPCSFTLPPILDCTNARDPPINEIPFVVPEGKVVRTLYFINPIMSIGPGAFMNLTDTLAQIYISEAQITTIDQQAFKGLSLLKDLQIKNKYSINPTLSNINIKPLLENLTSLRTLHLEGINVSSIPAKALPVSPLEKIQLTKTLTSFIDSSAFVNVGGTLKDLMITENPSLGSTTTAFLTPLRALQELTVENCRLSMVPTLPSSMARLENLTLSYNSITSVPSNSLKAAGATLKHLKLDVNALQDSQLAGFSDLSALESLDLTRNKDITAIPSQVANLPNLRYLHMESCDVKQITTKSFHSNSQLQSLFLAGNKNLYNIHSDAFTRVGSLEVLTLSDINLNSVTIDRNNSWVPVFQSIPNLRSLRLAKCGLDYRFWGIIKPLTKLRYLSLSNNNMSVIPPFIFSNHKSLVTLQISEAGLSSLGSRTFFGLPSKMTMLDLRKNKIKTIDNCTFSYFLSSVHRVNLLENPLVCDCRLRWLREAIDNQEDKTLYRDLICSEPISKPNNVVKKFLTLNSTEFTCPAGHLIPICELPIASTTQPSTTTAYPVFKVFMDISYDPKSKTISLLVNASNVLGSFFDHLTVTYTTENEETVSLPNTGTSAYVISGVQPHTNYTFCVILWKGRLRHKFEYNCRSFLVPHRHDIPVIVGACIGSLLGAVFIIVLIILLCKYRKLKKVRKISKNCPAEESIYDYDYPNFDDTTKPRQKSFVRPNGDLISLATTRTTIITDDMTASNASLAHGPAHNRHSFGNGRPGLAARDAQSTFNLPYNHRNYSPQSAAGKARSASVDHLNRRPQGRQLPPRPITSSPRVPGQGGEDGPYNYDTMDYGPESNSSGAPYLGMSDGDAYLDMSQADLSPPPLPPPRPETMPPFQQTSSYSNYDISPPAYGGGPYDVDTDPLPETPINRRERNSLPDGRSSTQSPADSDQCGRPQSTPVSTDNPARTSADGEPEEGYENPAYKKAEVCELGYF